MRDYWFLVNFVCSYILRLIFEVLYGINFLFLLEGEDFNRFFIAEELLIIYGSMRGYMVVNGILDCSRIVRYIFKDFVNGRLFYCYFLFDVDFEEFYDCGLVLKDFMEK